MSISRVKSLIEMMVRDSSLLEFGKKAEKDSPKWKPDIGSRVKDIPLPNPGGLPSDQPPTEDREMLVKWKDLKEKVDMANAQIKAITKGFEATKGELSGVEKQIRLVAERYQDGLIRAEGVIAQIMVTPEHTAQVPVWSLVVEYLFSEVEKLISIIQEFQKAFAFSDLGGKYKEFEDPEYTNKIKAGIKDLYDVVPAEPSFSIKRDTEKKESICESPMFGKVVSLFSKLYNKLIGLQPSFFEALDKLEATAAEYGISSGG